MGATGAGGRAHVESLKKVKHGVDVNRSLNSRGTGHVDRRVDGVKSRGSLSLIEEFICTKRWPVADQRPSLREMPWDVWTLARRMRGWWQEDQAGVAAVQLFLPFRKSLNVKFHRQQWQINPTCLVGNHRISTSSRPASSLCLLNNRSPQYFSYDEKLTFNKFLYIELNTRTTTDFFVSFLIVCGAGRKITEEISATTTQASSSMAKAKQLPPGMSFSLKFSILYQNDDLNSQRRRRKSR